MHCCGTYFDYWVVLISLSNWFSGGKSKKIKIKPDSHCLSSCFFILKVELYDIEISYLTISVLGSCRFVDILRFIPSSGIFGNTKDITAIVQLCILHILKIFYKTQRNL